jgi:NAD(P)-dependent dehydrogenase (short-subunit alcohol dehydrogenase family)
VITGGLGGFGLAMATWMAEKGARSLVLTSKRGMRTGEQAACVQRLRDSFGAKVIDHQLMRSYIKVHPLCVLWYFRPFIDPKP